MPPTGTASQPSERPSASRTSRSSTSAQSSASICSDSTEKIKDKYKIKITDSEKKISYKYLYAGTLDLKGYVNGKSAIIDIKTTYGLDELYVAWQNSLYELADGKVDELYCLWLPKGRLGKLVKLERIDKNYLLAII